MEKKTKLSKTDKRLNTLAENTKEQKEKILEQLLKHPIIQVACERSGVGRSTYYLWIANDKEFGRKASVAQDKGIDFLNDLTESMLVKNIQNGSNTAIIFWLKNRHKSYSDRMLHRHEFSIDREVTTEEIEKITLALYKIGLGNDLRLNKGEQKKIEDQREDEKQKHLDSWHNITATDKEESRIELPTEPRDQPSLKNERFLKKKRGVNLTESARKRRELK
jgi:hypothetical protein